MTRHSRKNVRLTLFLVFFFLIPSTSQRSNKNNNNNERRNWVCVGEEVECREAINIKLMLGNERTNFQGRRLM